MLPAEPVYHDLTGLAGLRAEAQGSTSARSRALSRAASEFEALLLQMVLKNMRETRLADDIFGSESEAHYRDWFDAQLALTLAHRQSGLGIGRLIVGQLSRAQKPLEAELTGQAGKATAQTPTKDESARSPEDFVRMLAPHAAHAAEELGARPEFLLAQAALESGWGRAEIRRPDGRPSYNVFGIKAGESWRGERVRMSTLEYEDGVAVRRTSEFRAYRSYAEAFADYVQLLRTSPRYAMALAHASDPERYAQALQQAGYATDPAYAHKLMSVFRGKVFERAMLALKTGGERPII